MTASPPVFVLWFGGQPMPVVRQTGLQGLRDSGLDVVLIRDVDVHEWVLPDKPLLPAFHLLSPIQRSDYFRAYLMHHHGGGYSDIKLYEGSWLPGLQVLADNPRLWAVGYPIQRWALSTLGVHAHPRYQPWNPTWWRYRWMQLNHNKILGGGGYVFRPRTELTTKWLGAIESRVRALTPALELNPGMYAKERNGDINDGIVSHYPVPWLHLAGDVLHPLAYRYRRHVATVLPLPLMENYQDPRPEGNSGPRDLTKD